MTEKLKEYAEGLPERRSQERRRGGFRSLEDFHDELTDELTKHAQRIEARLSRFFFRALLAFAVIGITSAGSLFGFAAVLRAYNDVGQQIQAQRKVYVKQTCKATNKRHKEAVSALITGSTSDIKAATTEAQRNDIRRRRDVTLALLDAIAPLQNCKAQAKTAVKEVK